MSTTSQDDVARVAGYAERTLNLAAARLMDEFYYQSLPLCVLDGVWITGVGYPSVRNVITRYCEQSGVRKLRSHGSPPPPRQEQESIGSFCDRLRSWGSPGVIADRLHNHQRTLALPRPSILKSEAVLLVGDQLREHGVEYLQDVADLASSLEADIRRAVRRIPGQGTGRSWDAIRMASGDDDTVLPTRWVQRFIRSALGREVDPDTAIDLVGGAARVLHRKYPQLTPRLLDNTIWQHQQRQ